MTVDSKLRPADDSLGRESRRGTAVPASEIFLATTALSEFWDATKRMVFLSSGCLRNAPDLQRNPPGDILPNPWDDRDRFNEAIDYTARLSEKLFPALCQYLNSCHGQSRSERYWRILFGGWLWRYICLFYDRYIRVLEAIRLCGEFKTIGLCQEYYVVPEQHQEFLEIWTDDLYNLQVFSQILTHLGYPFETKRFERKFPKKQGLPIRSMDQPLPQHCPEKVPILLLHEMYCGNEIFARLLAEFRPHVCAFPCPIRLFSGLPAAAFDSRRLGLANLPTEGEFESVLVKSLPHNLPVLLLEGLEPARATVLPNVRFFPSVIVSANAWQDNEVFKVYAAEAADAGSRFVGIQHGGGYGIHRTAAMEAVERSIVDRYLVWGWADDDPMQCRDAPSLQIQQRLDALQASPGRDRRTVLFLSTDDPWFKPVFSNIPIGEQFEEYFGWQFRFFEALSDEFHPRVLFRRYVHDYGRGIPEKLKARFPALQFDDMREWWRTLDERLNGARIVVADNNHTTWLFALAADIPTVVFWNPKHWELRPRAEPYFQDLRRVGILWDRPEAAAVHVQRVYGRVQDWWNSPEVQQVRKRFVQRYASSSENWVQEWRELLFNELRLSEESLPPNVARGRYPPPLRTPAPDAKNGEARNPTGNGLLIKNALSRLNSRLQRQAAATSKGSF